MTIEEIYRMYFQDICRYIRSISQNEVLAEDVTQETFFKAMKNIDSFRGDNIRAWLFQIAKRTLYDHYRRQKREELYDKQPDVPAPKEENPELKLAEHEDALRIHAVLHKLEEPYKEVFTLRTFGELSFSEIGQLFDKSANWARVTFHRAKLKIMEGLDHEDHV